MPAERTSTGSSQTAFRRVKWETRTVAIVAKPNVQSIVQASCKHFRVATAKEEFVLLGQLDGDELELTDESLDLLPSKAVLTLSRITPAAVPIAEVEPPLVNFMGPSTATSSRSGSYSRGKINLKFSTWQGEVIPIRMKVSSTFQSVMDTLARRLDKCEDDLRYTFSGYRIGAYHTPASLALLDDDTIDIHPKLTGGKPVIYLFPAAPLDNATVSVHLVPRWTFTHTYPVADTKTLPDGKQSVTWSVSAAVDGTLVEKDSNRELSYLFWEAASDATVPASPPLTPAGLDSRSLEHFDPAFPILEPHSPTAVLLSFDDLLPYLDSTLKSLTLHTAARNDFITYWLPKLSKQPYVALRFLPQAAYERAAQLEVTPAPDVVTRVFMLFRGVAAEDVDEWSAAGARVGSVDWAEVVGVGPDALDNSRFRVLEWGAMEAL